MVAYSNNDALMGLYFSHQDTFMRAAHYKNMLVTDDIVPIAQAVQIQLNEYFGGVRKTFTLPLLLHGTDFQKKAWHGLQMIPFGSTKTYSEQAAMIGSHAHRAIGSANGKNPIAIIIPCHRIIRKDGKVGGYAGGSHIKRQLLALECSHYSMT